jgi:hypothetical protein
MKIEEKKRRKKKVVDAKLEGGWSHASRCDGGDVKTIRTPPWMPPFGCWTTPRVAHANQFVFFNNNLYLSKYQTTP